MSLDLIWTLVGFLLTLMILSYLLGDNVFFRLATYGFVGVVAGYVVALVIDQVVITRLIQPLVFGSFNQMLLVLPPLVLSVLLFAKLSPRLASLGNLSMAYLVGVGAAVVIGGSVMGTILGQANGLIAPFDLTQPSGEQNYLLRLAEGGFMLVGAITSLIYFHFGARDKGDQAAGEGPRRSRLIEGLAKIGEIFIGITLGAVFAGVLSAALTALVERLAFIIETIKTLISIGG